MKTLIRAVLESDEKTDFQQLIDQQLSTTERRDLLRNEILQAFANYCYEQEKPVYFFRSSALGELIHAIHEMLLEEDTIWLVIRTRIASQESWRLSADLSQSENQVLKHKNSALIWKSLKPIFQTMDSIFPIMANATATANRFPAPL